MLISLSAGNDLTAIRSGLDYSSNFKENMRLFYIFISLIFFACVSSTKLENVRQVNSELWSGSAPVSKVDFNHLKEIGIKSLISVDGAVPELEKAKAAGMVYRHVPYSYGKISEEDQAKLIKAFSELPKPVYIHCHHGRHRAPAGAAVVLKNLFSWKGEEAVAMMKIFGTSREYNGLYETALTGKLIPESKWQKAKTAEVSEVDVIVREMAVIDRHWDELKEISKDGWNDRKKAAQETLLIRESFFELDRLNKNHYMTFEKSLASLKNLENSISNGSAESLTKQLQMIRNQCKSCHKKFRD